MGRGKLRAEPAESSVLSELSNITLGIEQQQIFDKLENTSDNYFITGKAGTGKSVLLAYFTAHTKKKIAVLASTGVAALNVAGQTIHSFYTMSTAFQDIYNSRERHRLRPDTKKLLKSLDAIVIDEISMVRSDVLTMLDAKTRFARRSRKPFGGCQIIMFGDPYQLPPIEFKSDENYLVNGRRYRGFYFFETMSYNSANISKFELSEVYRQKDAEEIEILNRIRRGEQSAELLELINNKCCGKTLDPDHKIITLTARNFEADTTNDRELNNINHKERLYRGRLEGSMKPSDCNTPIELRLKVGAQVMMTKNDSIDPDAGVLAPRWVNGTLATVTELGNDYVKVLIGNKEFEVNPVVWEKYGFVEDYSEDLEEIVIKRVVVGRFIQFPLKLAYAITIHKSQGQTYDHVRVDLGRGAFATGQTYVALSRCRSLNNLYLERPLRSSDIRVDPRVVEFMNSN